MALPVVSTQRYSTAHNDDLKACVTMAIVKIAQQVYAEDPTPPVHAKRAVLATNVLNSPDSYAQRFTYIVASDPSDIKYNGTNITDAQIEAAVSATWNAVAGA